ncbi:MAG: CTP synthase, partial [Candidatus Heimdallarchaeota archaeon LC_2]
GTMRLGSYLIKIKENTKIHSLYNATEIKERHRHRFEVNPEYFEKLQDGNLKFTGFYTDLVETLELVDHPYFLGVQYHPEFKSTPWKPVPTYLGLIQAAIKRAEERQS